MQCQEFKTNCPFQDKISFVGLSSRVNPTNFFSIQPGHFIVIELFSFITKKGSLTTKTGK